MWTSDSEEETAEHFETFRPTCTVVIATCGRPASLEQCLEAVGRLDYPRFYVLVVDNAPRDTRTREIAARRGVRYTVEPVVGLSRARNRGALECETEVVAYLDDDAVPEPGWLSGLLPEFEDPLVMAAAGLVRVPDAKAGETYNGASGCALSIGGTERKMVDRQSPWWFEMANFGGIGIGPNMAFRRRAFDAWAGFHERLGVGTPLPGFEECYAFFSLIALGYRVVYTPRAVVYHPYPARTAVEMRERQLRDLSAATGYFTFLLFEQPRYRWRIVKYVAEALWGTPRTWRRPLAGTQAWFVPWWRKLYAYSRGPFLYLHARLTRVSPRDAG